MAEESAMRATTWGFLGVDNQELHTTTGTTRYPANSLCLMPSGTERLGYLLRRAIQLIEIDVQAATRCLRDASRLLCAESEHRTAAPQVPRFEAGGLARWQTIRTVEYIEQNLGSKIHTRELADLLSFSKSHFSRAFKRTFGVSPMTYIFARRVERAKLMMTGTREQLTEIALSCGFADQSHLNRTFRRAVGMSPGLWRRTATDGAHTNAGVPE